MISTELSEAAVEVLEILKYTRKSDVEKIPRDFIRFLEENSSTTYKINKDYSKPISEIKLRTKTEALLGVIYLKYWADENGKKEFQQKLNDNEKKNMEQLNKKYNTEELFKNRNTEEVKEQDKFLVTKKENIFIKILNKIKNLFNIHS